MKRKKTKQVRTTWNISGIELPVKIFYEWRSSRRVSIGKNSIIARLPWTVNSLEANGHADWAKKWLTDHNIKNPTAFDHFTPKTYSTGDKIDTTGKTYYLSILKNARKTGSARLKGDSIAIKIPLNLSAHDEWQMIHSLVGRIIAQDNRPWVEKRVRWLNQHYFQKPIKSVKLKNNRSNWGSCSSGGNINISVRLLFAPEEVQDYVLIHELVHLKEMNHTSRFWDIVEEIMPDYREKEKWLKENSQLCDF